MSYSSKERCHAHSFGDLFSVTGISGVQAGDLHAQDSLLGGHGEAGLEQGWHEALQRPLEP